MDLVRRRRLRLRITHLALYLPRYSCYGFAILNMINTQKQYFIKAVRDSVLLLSLIMLIAN
jgi:hypothetical protein